MKKKKSPIKNKGKKKNYLVIKPQNIMYKYQTFFNNLNCYEYKKNVQLTFSLTKANIEKRNLFTSQDNSLWQNTNMANNIIVWLHTEFR